MKYIKHYYVDPVTNVPFSENSGMGPNGKVHPNIPTLDVHFWTSIGNGVDVCYSTVTGNVNFAEFPGVTEVTEEVWKDELEVDFNKQKEARKNQVFGIVQNIKAEVIDKWWHHSEIAAAMSIKITEQNAAFNAESEEVARVVAPFLTIEADARKTTVKDLAARVLANYNNLIAGEALLSGHRGFICDQIAALVFDRSDIDSIKASFASLSSFDINQGFKEIRTALGL